MAQSINDGGPAFPDPVAITPAGDAYPSNSSGMSLRDWFAGQALAGFACTANEELLMEDGETVGVALARHWSVSARAAYIVADAMLAAREATNG